MSRFQSTTQLVGKTPVVRLNRIPAESTAEVWVKLEYFNPARSVKDRAAFNMIEAAEHDGSLPPQGTIVEPTSGNTGIGLAMVAAAKGYSAVIVLPESSSRERVGLMRAYGAKVVLSPGEEGMPGAIRVAEEIVAKTEGAFMPQQFKNPANPDAHRDTTALEILEQMQSQLDVFVATCGTGGTITGTGEVLKARLPDLQVVAVEPASSPVLSGGKPGRHKIPGMGPGFIADVLNVDVYDEIVQVTDDEAWVMARRLAREEGLLLGPSSGASVCAALKKAAEVGVGKRVLCMAPDTGERYLSTGVYAED